MLWPDFQSAVECNRSVYKYLDYIEMTHFYVRNTPKIEIPSLGQLTALSKSTLDFDHDIPARWFGPQEQEVCRTLSLLFQSSSTGARHI